MSDISVQEPKSSGASPLAKLCRMLRSMLRRYPQARLLTTRDGFGVLLDAHTYMQVSYSGSWTDADMRDCHALFATWYVADPIRLRAQGNHLVGVSQMVEERLRQSSTQQG